MSDTLRLDMGNAAWSDVEVLIRVSPATPFRKLHLSKAEVEIRTQVAEYRTHSGINQVHPVGSIIDWELKGRVGEEVFTVEAGINRPVTQEEVRGSRKITLKD